MSCCVMPRIIRAYCSAADSPDGRGVAAVAAMAARVIATCGVAGGLCWADMLHSLASRPARRGGSCAI
ncbi:DDB1-and CUL4-associated factor-like 1 [Streptomyces laurentii]|uniref:DDB1-and CUL4-associated factor-like 1 n=1 Tax=Streptomyces laurentii TaxID=39478 RepID=A0A169N994_STRLU|nr:DDB1-and CUL4-associated factor-like 1 [Streptomyces laurentii]